MKASIVDLRYKTSEILDALERQEKVTILYHGKPRGIIEPLEERKPVQISQHEFFGMLAGERESVQTVMKRLRRGRHDL